MNMRDYAENHVFVEKNDLDVLRHTPECAKVKVLTLIIVAKILMRSTTDSIQVEFESINCDGDEIDMDYRVRVYSEENDTCATFYKESESIVEEYNDMCTIKIYYPKNIFNWAALEEIARKALEK